MNDKVKYVWWLGILLLSGCEFKNTESFREQYELEKLWSTSEGLIGCESVVFDHTTNSFYVSNSSAYDFTGKGYLSKYSADGDLIDSAWVTGLNRPTGMAILDDRLFIGDINRLVEVNIPAGEIINEYQLNGDDVPGLNDVAISHVGEVYVTASNHHAVYKLEENKLKLWVRDTMKLKWANGIVAAKKHLLVAGNSLAKIYDETRRTDLVQMSKDVNDFDGLQVLSGDGYLVSSAGGKNCIWYVSESGISKTLIRSENYFADFEFLSNTNKLVVATGNNATNTYELVCYRIIKN
ncbi:MAG: hypothetical protein ABJG47_11040 [Ekhidna sp.]